MIGQRKEREERELPLLILGLDVDLEIASEWPITYGLTHFFGFRAHVFSLDALGFKSPLIFVGYGTKTIFKIWT